MEKILETLGQSLPLVAVAAGFTIYYVVKIIAEKRSETQRIQAEAALKKDMLDRGMSVDEIVKVIQSSNVGAASRARQHGAPDLVGLAEQGIAGEDIARIQEAWGKAIAQIQAAAPAGTLDSAPDLVGLAEQGITADDLVKVIQAWVSTASLVSAPAQPAPRSSTEFRATS